MIKILKIGFGLGFINILMGLFIKFFMTPDTMFSPVYTGLSYLMPIIILIILGRLFLRTDDSQDLIYGDTLKYLFPAAFLGFAVSIVFLIFLYQNDEQMKEEYLNYTIKFVETLDTFSANFAGDSEDIAFYAEEGRQELIDNADEDYLFQWSKLPLNLLSGLFNSLIFSLIASIIVKRKASVT